MSCSVNPCEQIHEARAKVTLVVRMIASVGNYDYIIDWEFQTDGVVRVKVHSSSTAAHPYDFLMKWWCSVTFLVMLKTGKL